MNDTCAKCDAVNVRLYRPAGEFFREERVRCAPCARAETPDSHELSIDEIGVFVPFIRSENGAGEPWGIGAIPPADLDAWFDLPEV